MYIKRIQLENFRNYKKLDVSFDKRINIILGENAQGKTNLIESIYMTGFARSFRTLKDSDIIKFDQQYALVKADVSGKDYDFSMSVKITPEGKYVVCDGKKINRMADLLDKVYIVVFSPEDLKLVKDTSEKRRRFIDQEMSKIKPAYYDTLYNYRKVIRQRNAYLKEDDIRPDILDIWNMEAARYGEIIVKRRSEFIKILEEISGQIHSSITSGKEKLSIEYEPSIGADEDFYQVLADSSERDIRNRNTGRGPHRDDMKILINGTDIRHYGSQGQQRTAALSLKLAEIKLIKQMTGEDAILLLDDVLSELDQNRQAFLLNSLDNIQMFITSTDISDEVYKKIGSGKTYIVDDGNVK